MIRLPKRLLFGRMGLSQKLALIYSLMIMLPVIIVTWLGFQQYANTLKEKVSISNSDMLHQLTKNLDTYLMQLDRLSLSFYLDVGIENLVEKQHPPTPQHMYHEKLVIDRALKNIILSIPFQDIAGVYWIGRNNVLYSQYGSGPVVDHSNFYNDPLYRKVLKSDGKGIFLPTTRIQSGTSNDYIFSYARSMVDVYYRQSAGVLLIDISLKGIEDIVKDSTGNDNGLKVIVDEDNRYIYHPNYHLIGERLPIKLPKHNTSFIADFEGKSTMITAVHSAYSGWSVVHLLPVQELTEELKILRNLLWSLAAAALIFSISISAFTTSAFIKPLKQLKKMMRRVEEGDYSVRIPTPSADEVGQVGRSFNKMVEKINELVNNELVMKIFKQEAEFKLLQSQINPHFLYNTLESINMKAELNEDYEVAEMVSLLGRLFRLSMLPQGSRITLAREIEYVEIYLKLQQIRFPKIQYEVNLREFQDARTLPWILQPLVENAIIHGLVPKKDASWIRITGKRSGDELNIYIADDGAGMSREQLQMLREQLKHKQTGTQEHIGLKNVHDRIRHIDGEDYGISIQSIKGEGTVVEIRMKYMTSEGDEPCSS